MQHLTDTPFDRNNFKNYKYFFDIIAYIFCYALAYLSYLYNVVFSIEKKHASSDYELNLKLYRSNVVSVKCRTAYYLHLLLGQVQEGIRELDPLRSYSEVSSIQRILSRDIRWSQATPQFLLYFFSLNNHPLSLRFINWIVSV